MHFKLSYSCRVYSQELVELSMGTFKHIGRLRTARLIGKELASFYLCVHDLYYLSL